MIGSIFPVRPIPILAFMRETIPQEWTKFRDKVSDNFRVITHENFRVLQ
ncbi:hypothetical protein [Paracoccus actinidiae]|nr:hypothetical protein [Paracoccus sp. M09]